MTRALKLNLLKPIIDVFDPGDDTWAVKVQVAADTVYVALTAPAADKLTDGQFAALADLAFSVGADTLTGSAIYRLIGAGNFVMATYEFEKYVYGPDPVTAEPAVLPSLIQRRAMDKAVWLS